MNLKLLLASLLASGLLFLFASHASASEGQAEMRNLVGDPSRCVATSGLFAGSEYNILILCRDLVYRNNPEALYYIVWAQPSSGGDAIKLGDLGLGNAAFKTKTPFSRIFATQERDKNVKKPTGVVAMSGNMHPFSFFSNNSTSPVAPADSPAVTPTPTPEPQPSFLSRFRTGGVITVISIIVIIVMLVVVKPFK